MNRKCPQCSHESVPVAGLIVSNVSCANCGTLVSVHWLFRSVFFVVILIATILTAVVVLADQGLYAALLMISVPIGSLGYIKARLCPLVSKHRNPDVKNPG